MELNRRELLRAAGASAFAFGIAGCSKRRTIEGRIAGQDVERAHRLRDVALPNAPARREDVALLVVGGGVAGLSAAWTFARAGQTDFRVLELEDEVGGTSRGGVEARSTHARHPWGAHYVPIPTIEQTTFCALLADMDIHDGFDEQGVALVDEAHVLRAPGERHFWAGEWSEGLYRNAGASADDLAQLARFEEAIRELASRRGEDGRRWFTLPLAQGSRAPEVLELDALTIAQWLDAHGFDSPRLRWLVDYACRDDFGGTLEQISAFAGLHYFAARERDDEHTHYLTWPEGNAHLVAHLARRAESGTRERALVLRLESKGDHVRALWWDHTHGHLVETRAEHAVCAVPRFVARRIVPELAAERVPLEHSPWAVAHLELARTPLERGFPRAWDNVLHESDSLGYVDDLHQVDRPRTGESWTWYRPFCEGDGRAARERLLAREWASLRDEVLGDLSRAHPDLEECVERVDVWRWGHAMIRPTPGFLRARRSGALLERVGRIAFAGCDLSGMALFEEAQWSGVRAAETLLAERGVAFRSCL